MAKYNDNIIIMGNTLAILRNRLVWPKNEKRFMFYFKFSLLMLSTVPMLIGTVAHLVVALTGEEDLDIYFDICIIISLCGSYVLNITYVLTVNNTYKLYEALSDLDTFGKPVFFEGGNKKLNMISRYHAYYLNSAVTFFMIASLLHKKPCEKLNLEKGINENCGLMVPAWAPFDITDFPVNQLVVLFQMFCCYVVYVTSGFIGFSIVETAEHIILRIDHLNECFDDAFQEKDFEICKKKFGMAVQYHNFILECSSNLESSFTGCMFTHVLLTAVILGSMGNQLITKPTVQIIVQFLSWMFAMMFVCFSGQRLSDKTASIGVNICKSNWYDLDVSIQKSLVTVINRCNMPTYLTAGPFGAMNYEKLVDILKTSYSYLTLLNQFKGVDN